MIRAVPAILLVAACSVAPQAPHAPIPVRNPTTAVASQVNADPARVQGQWVVVQSSRARPGTPVRIGNGALQIGPDAQAFVPKGQGRFASGETEVWVHWLDDDDRTVAMGAPGGTWFAILDRTGRPGERLNAARDILEWYGYDLTRMMK